MRASKRSTQLQALAERLYRARQPVKINQLAEEFQCHRSKIFRMLRDLEDEWGIKLDRSSDGVWLRPEDYKLNVRLSINEVMALLLSVRAFAHQIDKHTPAAARALTALAEATRRIAPRLAEHIRCTAGEFDRRDERDEAYDRVLRALTEAWVEGYRVLLHYARSSEIARPFDVYFIEPSPLSARLTYVFGYDHSRGALRTFALERILNVTRTLETYDIPADFDPYALLARAWGVNWGDGAEQPIEVVLRFDPGPAAQRLQESRWHATQRITRLPNGGCEFRVIVARPEEMIPWIRQWGPDCEVIAPAEVRRRVAADMRRAALRYDASHGEE
ncbi:MAG: helix-turn-helix transcriptional regulator [Candidatus Brachytrichaceae bacterium NZ_4S206]